MNQVISGNDSTTFNINLGRSLFRMPTSDRNNSILVSNGSASYEGIGVGDLVCIDFTVNTINYDSLYVVTLSDDWIGYRRFQFMPDLHMLDSEGPIKITPDIHDTIKVVGEVTAVYKKT